ncbi:hypothetical protein Ddc_00732 [Ditylenchus destructor]|nr:hypothetical protein Ddc_00732 [Ditylenchus destructor]
MISDGLGQLVKQINTDEYWKSQVLQGLIRKIHGVPLISYLLLLDENVSNWKVIVTENDKRIRRHIFALAEADEIELVRFIINSLRVNPKDSDSVLHGFSRRILSGDIQSFLEFSDEFANTIPLSQWANLADLIFNDVLSATLNESDLLTRPLDVFTQGDNDNMSLGNPLCTTKRRKILFEAATSSNTDPSSVTHYDVSSIAIGLTTTIFLGSRSSKLNEVYIAGKFGDQHYITPHLLELDEEVTCAATGNNHALICCKNGTYYAVGDNSKNQLGIGTATTHLSTPKPSSLRRLFPGSSIEIVNCATSNNHTVLLTSEGLESGISEFFVCGTNVGQMGEYALRSFNQKLGPPQSFTRFLAPNDSFSNARFVGMALADDMTVIFVGSRVKVFFEYRDYKFTIDSRPGTGNIIAATVCKPQIISKTVVLLCTSNLEIYMWSKTVTRAIRPLWQMEKPLTSLSTEMTEYQEFNRRDADAHCFSCTQNGDFFIIDQFIPYSGCLVLENNRVKCQVEKMPDPPGFVKSVFASYMGHNVSFLVTSNPPVNNEEALKCRIEKREELFWSAQNPKLRQPSLESIFLKSKTKAIRLHKFLVTLRSPALLQRENASGSIDMIKYDDITAGELVEFIYLNTCQTLDIIEIGNGSKSGTVTQHMISRLVNGMCVICGNADPFVKECKNTADNSGITDYEQSLSLEDIDIWDVELNHALEKRLFRLCQLAKEISFHELYYCCQAGLNILQERSSNTVIPSFPFLRSDADTSGAFENADLILECRDGTLPFSKILLQKIPYFEALLHRWSDATDETENKQCCQLEDASVESVKIVQRYLIAQDTNGKKLTFEQIVELLLFSDKYMMVDLLEEMLDLFCTEINLDNLECVADLTNMLIIEKLDEMVIGFMIDHLAIILHSKLAAFKSLPQRVFHKLCNLVEQCQILKKDILSEESKEQSKLADQYIDTASDYLARNGILPDKFDDPMKLLRAVKRHRSHRSPKVSISDTIVVVDESNNLLEKELNTGDHQVVPTLEVSTPQPEVKKSAWKAIEKTKPIQIPEKNFNNYAVNVVSPTTPTRKSKSPFSWASSPPSTPPPLSLSDIMKEESRKIVPVKTPTKTPVKTPTKQSKCAPKSPSTSIAMQSWSTPLNVTQSQTDVTPTPSRSLREIQADEVAFNEAMSQPKLQKPMHLVDLEERAIQELEEYYNTIHEEGSCFFVVRRQNQKSEKRQRTASIAFGSPTEKSNSWTNRSPKLF